MVFGEDFVVEELSEAFSKGVESTVDGILLVNIILDSSEVQRLPEQLRDLSSNSIILNLKSILDEDKIVDDIVTQPFQLMGVVSVLM